MIVEQTWCIRHIQGRQCFTLEAPLPLINIQTSKAEILEAIMDSNKIKKKNREYGTGSKTTAEVVSAENIFEVSTL